MEFDSAKPHQGAAEQYRAFERECLEWAKTAGTERERQFFLQMATAWSTVTQLIERVRPIEEAIAIFFELAKGPAGSNAPSVKILQ